MVRPIRVFWTPKLPYHYVNSQYGPQNPVERTNHKLTSLNLEQRATGSNSKEVQAHLNTIPINLDTRTDHHRPQMHQMKPTVPIFCDENAVFGAPDPIVVISNVRREFLFIRLVLRETEWSISHSCWNLKYWKYHHKQENDKN